ncbi:hydantoinase/oxoprolinase family protein [Caldimonas tepidiphila]|uniref:hydantoinase/oxoprolinase family protein n=1 Tax=Caldimonas tepidiphila TaxID=2315841 RepID=UPI000E5A8E62|nr:hydantoinase/oxoprolinase family protein [Caldimonas tepidiphila]
MPRPELSVAADAPAVLGWDVGGAHVKACLLQGGRVRDVVQWSCPLWQGLEQLDRVLAQAAARWPGLDHAAHAVTMTGEMADLFEHREAGVTRIAQRMTTLPGAGWHFHAGDAGWCGPDRVGASWEAIASANWRATARLAARAVGDGVLVDIGSTTCDLIPLRGGHDAAQGATDAARLASGELVYHGVVRTPLCALARRIPFGGLRRNVMNEFFATTADVYRLTGELDPAHDLYPPADGGAKDAAATRRRLARMVGLDARDADDAQWLAFAQAWREEQLAVIGAELDRVIAAAGVPAGAPLVGAGCGDFLAVELAARRGRPVRRFADQLAGLHPQADPESGRWAQVCAPSVAVALLFHQEMQ